MLVVAVVLFILAVVVASIGVAGLTERLPRNRWVGIRTAGTLRDEEAFRLGNRVASPLILASALILAIGGFAAIAFDGVFSGVATLVAVVVAFVVAGMGASIGAQVAVPPAPEETGDCGSSCASCTLKGACETA